MNWMHLLESEANKAREQVMHARSNQQKQLVLT